jgi:homoserine acetyltransferase
LFPTDGGVWDDWDPEDLLVKARCWQNGDVGQVGGNGDWKTALKGVKARVLVMPCDNDQYFQARDCEEEVKFLSDVKLEIIKSVWGHAAGGDNPDDAEWVDGRIAAFLENA